MKKIVNITALTVVLTGILAVSSVQAQTSNAPELTANIPFAFSVKNQVWPAGEYTITCLNPASPNRVLRLSRKDGNEKLVLQTSSTIGKIRDDARLVFHRYADQYFLAQAWMPADNTGLAISKSRAEKEVQRRSTVAVRTETVALSIRKR
jgi:hypothetical protein